MPSNRSYRQHGSSLATSPLPRAMFCMAAADEPRRSGSSRDMMALTSASASASASRDRPTAHSSMLHRPAGVAQAGQRHRPPAGLAGEVLLRRRVDSSCLGDWRWGFGVVIAVALLAGLDPSIRATARCGETASPPTGPRSSGRLRPPQLERTICGPRAGAAGSQDRSSRSHRDPAPGPWFGDARPS